MSESKSTSKGNSGNSVASVNDVGEKSFAQAFSGLGHSQRESLVSLNLEEMWELNRDFQKALLGNVSDRSEKERIELTKEALLHISSEQVEMLRALGSWKTALSEEQPASRSGILEEVIDITKFLINICLFWDLTPGDFANDFLRKTEVNWQKFKQKMNPLLPEDKIAVFDLDGVLGRYPEDWITFLGERVHYMLVPKMTRIPEDPEGAFRFFNIKDLHHLAQELKIEQEDYDKLKHKWRETGWDGKLSVMPLAKYVLDKLKERNYKILILTRRPVERYKRIYADTIFWLKRNELPFDGIFWSNGEKEKEILSKFKNVGFVVEDDPVQAENLAKVGFSVFLLEKPYNREIKTQENLIVIERLTEIFRWLNEV